MKIIIFDDDPTGSQTVYGCPLVLQLNKEVLIEWFKDPSPLIFLLMNTRSLSVNKAQERMREACQLVKEVILDHGMKLQEFVFISRGDSTLRGHWILEPKIINEVLGPFDATFHVPSFFEGGRTTVDGIHLLNNIPVHQTIFAKDKIFGYTTSDLALWLQEKSNFEYIAKDIASISIAQLDDPDAYQKNKLLKYLSYLSGNKFCIVNAACSQHLNTFSAIVIPLMKKKRFLFRSAASLINSLSDIKSKVQPTNNFTCFRRKDHSGKLKPGLIIVGSHIQLAGEQLRILLQEQSCIGVHVDARNIANIFEKEDANGAFTQLDEKYSKELVRILEMHQTPVLYTSRIEVTFSSIEKRMEFGIFLAEFMSQLVSKISKKVGYIISKGGITTHILLSKGLKISTLHLKGQILPGLSVVSSYAKNQTTLPIITFPGNLGDKNTLLEVWKMMEII